MFRVLFPKNSLVDQNHSAAVDAVQTAHVLKLLAELTKNPETRELPQDLLVGIKDLCWLDKPEQSKTLNDHFTPISGKHGKVARDTQIQVLDNTNVYDASDGYDSRVISDTDLDKEGSADGTSNDEDPDEVESYDEESEEEDPDELDWDEANLDELDSDEEFPEEEDADMADMDSNAEALFSMEIDTTEPTSNDTTLDAAEAVGNTSGIKRGKKRAATPDPEDDQAPKRRSRRLQK